MPKSVPLRAITVTTVEPGMPAAAAVCSLQAGITRLRKKWSLPETNRTASRDVGRREPGVDQRREHLAQEHQRPGPVAVVALVAHLHHLRDDRLEVDAGRGAHRVLQQRPQHVGHPAQPLDHLRAERAVAQHLAQALVQRAPRRAVVHLVAHAEDPHRRRHHAGHRADRAASRGRAPRSIAVAGRQQPLGLLRRRGKTLEQHRADQRAAHRPAGALPVHRRPGVQELPASQPQRLRRREYVDQPRAPRPASPPAPAGWPRASRVAHHRRQRRRGRRPGGCQATAETSTAWAASGVGEHRGAGGHHGRGSVQRRTSGVEQGDGARGPRPRWTGTPRRPRRRAPPPARAGPAGRRGCRRR